MLYRTTQAADYLDLKKPTLEVWRCRGYGPTFIKMGKAVRYRKEDLDAFLDSKVRKSTSQKDPDRG